MTKNNSSRIIKLVVLPALAFLCVWGIQSFVKGFRRPVETPERRQELIRRKDTAYFRLASLCVYARQYADDHAGYLPSSLNWEDALRPYAVKDGVDLEKIVTSPFLPGPRHFAMNKALSGVNILAHQKLGGNTYPSIGAIGVVLFYDAISTIPNASGNLEPLPPLSNDAQTAVGFLEVGVDALTFYNANLISPIRDLASVDIRLLESVVMQSRKLEPTLNSTTTPKPPH